MASGTHCAGATNRGPVSPFVRSPLIWNDSVKQAEPSRPGKTRGRGRRSRLAAATEDEGASTTTHADIR